MLRLIHGGFHYKDPIPPLLDYLWFKFEFLDLLLAKIKVFRWFGKPSNNRMEVVHIIYFHESMLLLTLPLINHINLPTKLLKSADAKGQIRVIYLSTLRTVVLIFLN